MTHKFFTKLLALFLLLLLFHTLILELVFRGLVEQKGGTTLHMLGREALWAGFIALAVAIPVSVWVAGRISAAA